jgi:hypothetical protein
MICCAISSTTSSYCNSYFKINRNSDPNPNSCVIETEVITFIIDIVIKVATVPVLLGLGLVPNFEKHLVMV